MGKLASKHCFTEYKFYGKIKVHLGMLLGSLLCLKEEVHQGTGESLEMRLMYTCTRMQAV